jgi:hypothetical protein
MNATPPDEAALARIRDQIVVAGDLLDTGKTGEAIIAALHPDWERAKPCNKGWDFKAPDRGTVQIKTEQSTSRRTYYAIQPGADWLIVIVLDGVDWTIICDCPITAEHWSSGYRDPRGKLAWRRWTNRIAPPQTVKLAA